MLELQQRKKALAAGIYEAGGSAAASLDAADIERLFEPLGREGARARGVTNRLCDRVRHGGVFEPRP